MSSHQSAGMNGKERSEWKKEHARRIKAGWPKKYMSYGRYLVQDDHGNWYAANGNACCGCGRHQQSGHHVTKKEHEQKPRWKPITDTTPVPKKPLPREGNNRY